MSDDVLRTAELTRRLGYRDKRAVRALFSGAWNVPGGTMMLPGRGKSGYEFGLPRAFFEKWLKARSVS